MSKLSKILTGIVVIIILVFVVNYFRKDQSSGTGTLTVENRVAEIGDAKYVLGLLNKMSEVTLRDAIFSDQSFMRLKDNSVTLTPQPVSRDNPFAPVSASEISSASTTPR